MRYTPYLDEIGVTFGPEVPDPVVNILDSALHLISAGVEWGEYKGRKRKPCSENPVLLSGQPIGMYHCPVCLMMVMASLPHTSPACKTECTCEARGDENPEAHADSCFFPYPLFDYEVEYGREWPPGYEDAVKEEDGGDSAS